MHIHMYVHSYVCIYIYKIFTFYGVVSSVITAIPMLMYSPVASQLYNITVTCIIHPDSTADLCIVMAMADGRVTRTGEYSNTCVCTYVICSSFTPHIKDSGYVTYLMYVVLTRCVATSKV